jgi:hypothetical protein
MKKSIITLLFVAAPIFVNAQQLAFTNAKNAYYRALSTNSSTTISHNRLDKALDAYMRGLNHTLPAIVESSMFNLLVLRIDYPEIDYTEALKKLDEISVNGKTSVLRYKAYVTTEYLKNPTLFLDVDPVDFSQYMDVERADYFYLALSKALQNQLTVIE